MRRFEYDEAALKTYLPLYPCVSYGNPDNTGDGIRMAVGAGADLWHMAILGGSWKARFPDFPTAFGVGFGESSLIVDQSATRFAAETQLGGYDGIWNAVQYDPANNTWPRIPAYLIFDEKRRLDSRLVPTAFGAAGPIGMYAWSEDNSAEIERGWITRANTIAGLASKLDLDADTLDRETVKFNNYARRGEDADFGRAAESMLPVDQPPYYAMLLWPGLNNTFGGPRRNARAQIIDLHGEPIPRLYSAGELGSVYVQYPQGGANLGECIAFGRIAGERAADLKVWG